MIKYWASPSRVATLAILQLCPVTNYLTELHMRLWLRIEASCYGHMKVGAATSSLSSGSQALELSPPPATIFFTP